MILVVDGNNIICRAFFTPQGNLCTKAGEPTGSMLGFLNSLQKYVDKFPTVERVVVCWDSSRAQWRKDLCPEYKANRTHGKEDPKEKERWEGLFKQIDILHDFLPHLGVYSVRIPGTEGDDLMAGVCKLYPDRDKMLVSSDKDIFQLVDEKTSVYTPYKDKIIGEANFYDECGVTKKAYMGYRSLVGDTSDNINGVQGIGDKTAKGLMDKYGHIDNILNPTPEDKKVLMKSKRTARIFEPENLSILGRNHKIMNFDYVEYDKILPDIENTMHDASVETNSKSVKDFLMRWQFVQILSNYTPFILSFKSLGEDE